MLKFQLLALLCASLLLGACDEEPSRSKYVGTLGETIPSNTSDTSDVRSDAEPSTEGDTTSSDVETDVEHVHDDGHDHGHDIGEIEDPETVGETDWIEYGCSALDDWEPFSCEPGRRRSREPIPSPHISEPEEISYLEFPPTSGPHRPQWPRWGEYEFIPPQRWVHSLEHGGIVFLYHPCVDPGVIEELRLFIDAREPDAGGAFRWILTPAPGLDRALALVAWGEYYTASCVQPEDMTPFIDDHYRHGPEDVAIDGAYQRAWIRR